MALRLAIPDDTPDEQCFTVAELAMQWRVSKSWIHQRMDDGELGYIDMASKGSRKQPRIPASKARAFIAARTMHERKAS